MIVNQRRPYKAQHLKIVDSEGSLVASFNPNCEDFKQIQEFCLNALNGGAIPLETANAGTWLTGFRQIYLGEAAPSEQN